MHHSFCHNAQTMPCSYGGWKLYLSRTIIKALWCLIHNWWISYSRVFHPTTAVPVQTQSPTWNRASAMCYVVLTRKIYIIIPDVDINLIKHIWILEYHDAIVSGGCGQREKHMASLEVCKGPVDITKTCDHFYYQRYSGVVFLILLTQHYLRQMVPALYFCRDGISLTWAVLVSCAKVNIWPYRSLKNKLQIQNKNEDCKLYNHQSNHILCKKNNNPWNMFNCFLPIHWATPMGKAQLFAIHF